MRESAEKSYIENQKRKEYNQKLSEAMREARNKAHIEESVKQAKISGRLQAKKQFGQKKFKPMSITSNNPAFESLFFGGSPRLKSDIKKSIKPKRNIVDDLIWRL